MNILTKPKLLAILMSFVVIVSYYITVPLTSVNAATTYSGYSLAQAQKIILTETNAARKKHGLPALKVSSQMNTVAVNWSKTQASKGKMYHNPNYSKQIPSKWITAAENVASGYSVKSVTGAWIKSPGHKANILNKKNTHIGIGVAKSKNGTLYYTQVFAGYSSANAPKTVAKATTYKTVKSISFRTKPSNNASRYFMIPKSANIGSSKGVTGSWMKVTYKGKTGYVNKNYLKKS